jgi:cob(I)alamin adenosyltransferase
MEWKIYTKTGDSGKTSLIGGTRVPKYDERIEAYGTVDELNAFIGLLHDQYIDSNSKKVLSLIQNNLFVVESHLAVDSTKNIKNIPELKYTEVEIIEKEIDTMNKRLPELKSFILPGGHPVVSYCHICRTICRRAERHVVKLSENYQVDENIIKYLNRLSDYFFVLGRKIAIDLGVEESLWKPKK